MNLHFSTDHLSHAGSLAGWDGGAVEPAERERDSIDGRDRRRRAVQNPAVGVAAVSDSDHEDDQLAVHSYTIRSSPTLRRTLARAGQSLEKAGILPCPETMR